MRARLEAIDRAQRRQVSFIFMFHCDRQQALHEVADLLPQRLSSTGRRADVNCIQAEPGGEPFVLRCNPVTPFIACSNLRLLIEQPLAEHHHAADQARQCERVGHAPGHIADAELDGAQISTRPNVPLHILVRAQHVAVAHRLTVAAEVLPAGEMRRDAGMRHDAIQNRTGRRKPGIHALPERRIGGKRENVRQVLDQQV